MAVDSGEPIDRLEKAVETLADNVVRITGNVHSEFRRIHDRFDRLESELSDRFDKLEASIKDSR